MKFSYVLDFCEENNVDLSEAAILLEMQDGVASRNSLIETMNNMYEVMKESASIGTTSPVVSTSGLTGGEGYKLMANSSNDYTTAAALAMGIANVNSSMGRIVASPTAGSCGILPAVLITLQNRHNFDDDKIVSALFVAGIVGKIIASNACISGAQGGCQAECGSASAMAASAGVWLLGGTPKMSFDACSSAIEAVMGLICDPVAGLVEIPCIKRNAFGALQALLAIELTMSGIESPIPPDEVIEAMKNVGKLMHSSLKETSKGGLAATKTALEIAKKLNSL